MGNQKIIKELHRLMQEIPNLKELSYNCIEYKKWGADVLAVLKVNFKAEPTQYKEFEQLMKPSSIGRPMISDSYQTPTDYQAIYIRKLNSMEIRLKSILKEIELTEDDSTESSNVILTKILKGFLKYSRQMQKSYNIILNNEKNVQDLLYILLQLHFNNVCREESTPSHSGAASRIDFLLKKEKIGIEVKMTRPTLKDKELGEQLAIDKERYQSHPDCKSLVFFIYDPETLTENPQKLGDDLRDGRDDITVIFARPFD